MTTIKDWELAERFSTKSSPPESSNFNNVNEFIIKKRIPVILVKSMKRYLEIDVFATSLKTARKLFKFGKNKFIICFT